MRACACFIFLWIGCALGTAWSEPVVEVDQLNEMFARGDFASAEAELRKLLTLADDPLARDLLGVALVRQGRPDEAEVELRRAVEMQPDYQAAWQHLARLYLARGNTSEALPALRTAAVLGDLERDLAMSLAQLEIEDGRPEPAKAQLRRVAEEYRSVRARLSLARILAKEGNRSEALDVLGEALELAPNSEAVLSAYAQGALDSEMPIPAIITLGPLIRMYPTNASYNYKMGLARLQVGDTMGAVQYLTEARELGPPRAMVLIALGLALTNEKRFAEAEEALMAALRLEPELLEIHAALAEAQASLDRLESAEEHAARALKEYANDTTANFAMGLVRMKQGRFEEAVSAFEEAERSDPKSPKIHYQLSMALVRSGQRERSQEQLELYRKTLQEQEDWLDQQGSQVGAHRGGM